MSGIAGWVDYERDLSRQTAVIESMTETLARRGPDDAGVWIGRHAAIGHRRLAVIDPVGGVQPMQVGDPPVVLAFDGEIYNLKELRRELESHGQRFRTRSDAEVVLHAYLQWGANCLPRLNGIFALAIWDEREQRLLLARDRLGVKPLYYYPHRGGLVFGSEPKALLANPVCSAELDEDGMAALFAEPGTRPPGQSFFRRMLEVPPGGLIGVGERGLRALRYWRLEPRPHSDDLGTTIATVRALLEDIVQRQLIGDVAQSLLLSGGVDSSALTALAAQAFERRGNGRVPSVSVDFRGHETDFRPEPARPARDEPFVQLVVAHVRSKHTSMLLDVPDLVAAEDIPLRAADLPDPSGNMATTMYLLFDEVRRHCTVALSGESADEVFGGYHWFQDEAALAADEFPWASDAGQLTKVLRDDVRERLRVQERIARSYAEGIAEVPELEGEDARDRRVRQLIHLGLTHWLPFILDRKDRMSMAVGLEVRLPYVDHRLVEYIYSVPWSMKTTGGIGKGLLRKAVADLLPTEVAQRPKSMFPAVRNPGYEQGIRDRMTALLDRPDAPLFHLVDPAKVRPMLDQRDAVTGIWSVPGPLTWAAYLLRINDWLVDYDVRMV